MKLIFPCILVLIPAVLSAQPYFTRKDIPVTTPTNVLAGDFDGDGRPDILVVKSTPGALYYDPTSYAVYLNRGAGVFGPPVETLLQNRFEVWQFVADFNNDGKDDVINGTGVLLSRGDGTFSPPIAFSNFSVLATGDFNGDKKVDLLLINGSVLLGNGDGSFRQSTFRLDVTSQEVLVADLNGDGRSDVVIGVYATSMKVYLAQTSGFANPVETRLRFLDGYASQPFFLAADFNGDGQLDLSTPSGVLLGTGGGAFRYATDSFPYSEPWFQVAAGDFTGDGYADIVIRNRSTSQLSILAGSASGAVSVAREFAVGCCGYASHWPVAAAADWNADKRLDLVVVNHLSNTMSILTASATASPSQVQAVSVAGGATITAPGSLAALYTTVPITAATTATSPWPVTLGGLSLTVHDSAGVDRLAPLVYVSPTQINFQVPSGVANGEATLAVGAGGLPTEVGRLQVSAVAPGLYTAGTGIAAGLAIRVESDASQTVLPLATCSDNGLFCSAVPIPMTAAPQRPIYLSLFGTGFTGASNDNIKVTGNGVPLPVTYAGAHGYAGLDQINLRLPPDILSDVVTQLLGGAYITVSINDIASNTVWVSIE